MTKHAEAGRHDIETLGHVLTDLVERTTTARTGLRFNIDNLFDPLEMCGQRTAVGLAWPRASSLDDSRLARGARLAERGLDIFEAELELVGIELLGLAPEPVAHERVDDRLEPLDLRIGLALGDRHVGQLAGLLERERAKRFDVFGQVRFHQHEGSESAEEPYIYRQSAGRLACVHRAPGANPDLRAKHPIVRKSAASRRPGSPAT